MDDKHVGETPQAKAEKRTKRKRAKHINEETDDNTLDSSLEIEGRSLNAKQLAELMKKIDKRLEGGIAKFRWDKALQSLNWESLNIDEFTPDECKSSLERILKKVRKFRNLREVLVDAEEFVLNPKNAGFLLPNDLPKKPVTIYMMFFKDHLKKYKEKYPDLMNPDITRMIATKFKELPPHKKEKYREKYNEAMVNYKEKENPDQATVMPFKDPPPKPTSASNIFVEQKLESYLQKYPEDDKNRVTLMKGFRKSYVNNLSDKKKIKYIQLALKAKEKYEGDMKAYIEKYPDTLPKITHFITKDEQKILDRFNGIPDKPPTSGYMLYCQTMARDSTAEKKITLIECSQMWNKLDLNEKDRYAKESEKLTEEYNVKLQSYLAKLSPEDRDNFEQERKKKKPPKKAPEEAISALMLYQSEKRSKFIARNPEASTDAINNLMETAFNKLPPKKKAKYEQQYAMLKESLTKPPTPKKIKNTRERKKKFPISGYHLYLNEMKTQMAAEGTDADLNKVELTALLNGKYKELSKRQKQEYKDRQKVLKAKLDAGSLSSYEEANGVSATPLTSTSNLPGEVKAQFKVKSEKAKTDSESSSSGSSGSSSSEVEESTQESSSRKRKKSSKDEGPPNKRKVENDNTKTGQSPGKRKIENDNAKTSQSPGKRVKSLSEYVVESSSSSSDSDSSDSSEALTVSKLPSPKKKKKVKRTSIGGSSSSSDSSDSDGESETEKPAPKIGKPRPTSSTTEKKFAQRLNKEATSPKKAAKPDSSSSDSSSDSDSD